MALRLITHVFAAAALVVASVLAMADQSDKPIGANEIPPFVLERVELTPGAASQAPLMAGRADEQDCRIALPPKGT